MTVVQASKGKLSKTGLTDKCKVLKKSRKDQSCIATSRKYGVDKNTASHWLKRKSKIFEAVNKNNVSKKLKIIIRTTFEDVDFVME